VIRRIAVWGQLREKKRENPISNNTGRGDACLSPQASRSLKLDHGYRTVPAIKFSRIISMEKSTPVISAMTEALKQEDCSPG
jgi:hypothetical protein